MSEFFDHLRPDPGCEGRSLPWTTAKPLFQDAVVAYAPLYPEYAKMKTGRVVGSASDPGSPHARLRDETVDVFIYSSDNGTRRAQEETWKYIQRHAAEIEMALRRKLFAYHLRNLEQFLNEYLPESKAMQKYWNEIETNVAIREASAVDQFFKLAQISIADTGLDECGFCSFEFQTGWDRDHGIGVLMHKSHVLASGGLGELIYSPKQIVDSVKIVQSYSFDEGDLRIA